MNTFAAGVLAALALATAPVHARDGASNASAASALAADGSAMIVDGSLLAAAGSGVVVVKSVEASAEALVFVVASAADAASATIRLSGRAAKEASIAAGQSLQVMAVSTGLVLVSAGKVLAFLPNEAGKALLHHSRADT